MDDELKTVKKVLKSLIVSVSAPSGLPIRTLNKDFAEIEGRPIPFKQFGYQNLLDFLYSIRDTLTVNSSTFFPFENTDHNREFIYFLYQINNYNGENYAKPVLSQEMAHISQLVREQNKKSGGRPGGLQRQ